MIKENVNLQPYNTFGLSAEAQLFGSFSSVDELHQLITEHKDLPLLVLGGGSNILLTKNVEGLP